MITPTKTSVMDGTESTQSFEFRISKHKQPVRIASIRTSYADSSSLLSSHWASSSSSSWITFRFGAFGPPPLTSRASSNCVRENKTGEGFKSSPHKFCCTLASISNAHYSSIHRLNASYKNAVVAPMLDKQRTFSFFSTRFSLSPSS